MTQDILSKFSLGFEFEFLTKLSQKELVKLLKKFLNKSIVVPYSYDEFDKEKLMVHSDVAPTETTFKLERDHSADDIQDGKIIETWELITGPIPYQEARLILIKILEFIKRYCWTTEKTGIHVNISYKTDNNLYNILSMDRLKFCLHFDESIIWKYFPNRKNNVYAQSIKRIRPINHFAFFESVKYVIADNYSVPNTKYFGVNFLKQQKNYLEFRYLGGEGYETKVFKILELCDYFCTNIYDVLSNPRYDESDIVQLNKILKFHKKAVLGFVSFENFVLYFPDIILMVDLKSDEQLIKTFFNSVFRFKLYDLITLCGMKKGYLNYDRDVSRFQIKNAELSQCIDLRDYDLINCKINGLVSNCELHHCDVESSNLEDCDIRAGNLVKTSKIKNSPIEYSNKMISCYIENKDKLLSGKYENCIIRHGLPNELAILKNCVILDKSTSSTGNKDKK